jgi:hypothetical protein
MWQYTINSVLRERTLKSVLTKLKSFVEIDMLLNAKKYLVKFAGTNYNEKVFVFLCVTVGLNGIDNRPLQKILIN